MYRSQSSALRTPCLAQERPRKRIPTSLTLTVYTGTGMGMDMDMDTDTDTDTDIVMVKGMSMDTAATRRRRRRMWAVKDITPAGGTRPHRIGPGQALPVHRSMVVAHKALRNCRTTSTRA